MKNIFFLLSLLISFPFSAQTDAETIKKIYDTSLSNGKSYEWLDYLSNQIGGRLSGSLNAERAVKWTKEELDVYDYWSGKEGDKWAQLETAEHKGRREGRQDEKRLIAKNLLDILDNETIAVKTGLDIGEIEHLRTL